MRTIHELKIDHSDSKANVLYNQWTKLLKRTFWQFKETAKIGNDSWRDWPDIESRIVMKNAMAGVYHSSRWPAVTIYFWKHKWSFAICINKYDMAPSKHSAPQIDGLYYGEKVLRSCCWLAGEKEELNDFLNDQTGLHTHTHTRYSLFSSLFQYLIRHTVMGEGRALCNNEKILFFSSRTWDTEKKPSHHEESNLRAPMLCRSLSYAKKHYGKSLQ